MTPKKLLLRHAFSRAAPRYDGVADYQREAGLQPDGGVRYRAIAPQLVLDAGCSTGLACSLIAAA